MAEEIRNTNIEDNEEKIDPKLQELVERFNELAKDCFDAGYIIQPHNELSIRIVKVKKESPIMKGFRGFVNPNKKRGY